MDKFGKSNVAKVGFRVREFCESTSLGRSHVYELIKAGHIKYVKVGGRTVITTTPAEFIARSATQNDVEASSHQAA